MLYGLYIGVLYGRTSLLYSGGPGTVMELAYHLVITCQQCIIEVVESIILLSLSWSSGSQGWDGGIDELPDIYLSSSSVPIVPLIFPDSQLK